jgi:hypothetical protein
MSPLRRIVVLGGVLYPRAKSKALSRIIILGALIAAFVNVRGAQAR